MSNNGKECKALRLTPTNEQFVDNAPDAYWVLGDIFL